MSENLNNESWLKKLMEDISLDVDEIDVEDFVDETFASSAAIAYYPSLRVPGDEEEEKYEADKVTVRYSTGDDKRLNKLFIHKANMGSTVGETYEISINSSADKAQIGLVTHEEMKQCLGESYNKFSVKFPNGFEIRNRATEIQEAFNSMKVINESWLGDDINTELRLVRGLLTVFRENDMELFEDNFEEYYVSMNWLKNSPILEEIEDDYTDIEDDISSYDLLADEVKLALEVMVKEMYPSTEFDESSALAAIMSKSSLGLIKTEKTKMVNSLYNAFDTNGIAEITHLVALFLYIKNFTVNEKAMLAVTYPLDASPEEIIAEAEVLTIYGSRDARQYVIVGYDENDEVYIDNSDELDFADRGFMALTDLNENIALVLLNSYFVTREELISSIFFNENSKDLYYTGEQSELSEATILNEDAKVKSLRAEIMKKINDVYKNLDKTGLNGDAVRGYWDALTDTQFMTEMRKFVNDSEANFKLEVLPNKNEPSLTDITKALKAIKVPESEYVYFRHLEGTENNPIRTRYPVTVGYIHIRRLRAKCFIERYLKVSRLMRGLVLILNYLEDSLLSTY